MNSLDCVRRLGMMVSYGNASGRAAGDQPAGAGQARFAVPDPPDPVQLHRHARGTGRWCARLVRCGACQESAGSDRPALSARAGGRCASRPRRRAARPAASGADPLVRRKPAEQRSPTGSRLRALLLIVLVVVARRRRVLGLSDCSPLAPGVAACGCGAACAGGCALPLVGWRRRYSLRGAAVRGTVRTAVPARAVGGVPPCDREPAYACDLRVRLSLRGMPGRDCGPGATGCAGW